MNALTDRRIEMNRLPAAAIDRKAALHALPPLIKATCGSAPASATTP